MGCVVQTFRVSNHINTEANADGMMVTMPSIVPNAISQTRNAVVNVVTVIECTNIH